MLFNSQGTPASSCAGVLSRASTTAANVGSMFVGDNYNRSGMAPMTMTEAEHSAIPAAYVAQLLTRADVQRITGLSRSSVYRLMRSDRFPEPVKLEGVVRWRADEVCEWLDALPRATGNVGAA